jgi:GxxExxY protein
MTPMNADEPPKLHVRECYESLLEEALTRKIIGAFFHVHTALGYGFLEPVYKKALELELVSRGVHVAREVVADVYYKNEMVGVFRADIIVESRVVLEVKTSRKLDPGDVAQLLNYLRATDLELGLLLHFGQRASFKRLIASNDFVRPLSDPRSSAPSALSVAPLADNAVAFPPLRPK